MKTIEEAAKEQLKMTLNVPRTFRDGVEFAQRWISVEEELPENGSHGFSDLVLTKNSVGEIHLERYDFEYNRFTDIRYDALVKGDGQVSHWRQIELK